MDDLLARVRDIPHYRHVDYTMLVNEFGQHYVQSRLEKQLELYRRVHGFGEAGRSSRVWKRNLYRACIQGGLRLTGLWQHAKKLARSPEWIEREVQSRAVPLDFDGYRILHLSDFHFDFNDELADIVLERLSGVSFDVCVLTGDYRGEVCGPFVDSLRDLEKVRSVLGDKVYAILGNHDSLEMIIGLRELDVTPLLNEAVRLRRGNASLVLAGIDDPHYYRLHHFDFADAFRVREEFSILLSHSPEAYRDAAEAGFDFLLAGHTHGGQVCLPGGRAVITHLHETPPKMIKGAWSWEQMQGYTSRGVGASTLDIRLNCPPEITVHTLKVD